MEFGSYGSYEAARAYVRAADRLLAKACGKSRPPLARGAMDARSVRLALASSGPAKPGREGDLAVAKDLAAHACDLLGAMEFRYVKTAAADRETPIRNCILFREGDKALRMDAHAWRIPTAGRADGKNVAVIRGAYESARDSRKLGEAAAVPVTKIRVGLRHYWVRTSVLEERPGRKEGAAHA